MNKLLSLCLLTTFLVTNASFCPAQNSAAGWDLLSDRIGQEIAVKTKNGATRFGVLRTVENSEIKVQLADRKNIANAQTSIQRDEIEKVWLAKLRFGGRRIGTGALIGAGAGAGAGLITVATHREDGQAGVAVPVLALYGAVIGGVIGFFAKKSHKKERLIFSS